MSARCAPSILVFDVNETLLDLTTLEPLFDRVFGDAAVMRQWFAQLILYSEAVTLSGLYAPFDVLAAGVLRMVGTTSGTRVTDADIGDLKEAIGAMPAHDDVVGGLDALQSAGFRLVTLTNSPPAQGPTPLERAGIARYFEGSYSVDRVRRFKPAPETYRHVATELGCELPDMCLVACHLWDTIGAQAAGCQGALIERPGNAVLHARGVPEPDIVADDMMHLTEQLLALRGGGR